MLESSNDDPIIKGTVKGISSVSTVGRSQTPQDLKFARTISNQSSTSGPGTLVHTNTNSSTISNGTTGINRAIIPTTVLDSPSPNEKVLYPFRVKHLGKTDLYVLYASTAQNRQDWCDKIIEAKTRHAASLFAQNAEPFRLRVMADTAFAYDGLSGSPKSTVIRGTPLDRAIRKVESQFDGPRPSPVCRAQVNCATAFNQPYGKQMIAVGTDFGVYISDYNNPRGWTRVSQWHYRSLFTSMLTMSSGHCMCTCYPSCCTRRILSFSHHSQQIPHSLPSRFCLSCRGNSQCCQ